MAEVDALHDLEGSMLINFKPGSLRHSQRLPLPGDKILANRANRDAINALNKRAFFVSAGTRRRSQKVDDGQLVASELVALLRLMIYNRLTMQNGGFAPYER